MNARVLVVAKGAMDVMVDVLSVMVDVSARVRVAPEVEGFLSMPEMEVVLVEGDEDLPLKQTRTDRKSPATPCHVLVDLPLRRC